jgi:hypothetical protein
MSTKLRVFGLSLLAVGATSAFTVVNTPAESQPAGHFVMGTPAMELLVIENPPSGAHMFELAQPGFNSIVCHEASYFAPVSTATVTDVTVTPTYKGCQTTGGATGSISVDTNGCTYTFQQPNKESAKTENTVKMECPAGKTIQITHATCTVTVHPQTVKGVGYTTTSEALPGEIIKQHAITLTANVGFAVTRHGGFCTLLATNATATLSGAATVFGTETTQVGITATGSIN